MWNVQTNYFTVPRDCLYHDIDYVGRSSFANHMYALNGDLIFDACAGPVLGTQNHLQYLERVIDYSTVNELINGYYLNSSTNVINRNNVEIYTPDFSLE